MKINIQSIDVHNINAAPYNPRIDLKKGDEEYEKLKSSIQTFGYVDPLVWNERTGNLVGGHQRFKIMMESNPVAVDVSVVDLSEEDEKVLNIALNKTGGDWDYSKLTSLLEELQQNEEIDFSLTGFSEDEFESILNDLNTELPDTYTDVPEDDFDAESAYNDIQAPTTQKGDIWLLGKHRLICGDSTDSAVIERLMDGNKADMVFTDPPYNVDYTGKTKDALTIQNDHMDNDTFYQFLSRAYTSMYDATKEGGAIYVCHADSEGLNFRKGMIDTGWLLKQCIVWVKNNIVLGRQDYHWKHEPILYGWKPGASHRWNGDRKQSTVWEFDKPLRNADHPTMKPIGIPARAIQNSSKEGNIILDVFGGSGSTLLAAEQTGRICYTSELDPKYCDVIVKRYEEHTGQSAVRIKA